MNNYAKDDTWSLPWTASCLCGQVTMKITEPPLASTACHCTGCQKLTSGPYSLSLLIPETGFHVVATDSSNNSNNNSASPVIGGLHKENNRHYFCPHCKNWLFNRPLGMPLVNFRPGMLDDASWVRPIMETMTAEQLPFAHTGAEFSFPGFAGPDDFGPIMAAFADHGARPPPTIGSIP